MGRALPSESVLAVCVAPVPLLVSFTAELATAAPAGSITVPVTDPVILATKVDGVLLVVSAGQTTRECCRLAVQSLTAAGGKILGIVLQKARVTAAPYYFAYSASKNGVTGSGTRVSLTHDDKNPSL